MSEREREREIVRARLWGVKESDQPKGALFADSGGASLEIERERGREGDRERERASESERVCA